MDRNVEVMRQFCYFTLKLAPCSRPPHRPEMLTNLTFDGHTAALAWIGLAILATVGEWGITNFIFIFVAAAAFLAALLAWMGLRMSIQVTAFAACSWILPVLLRAELMRRFGGRGVPSRTDRLLGLVGEVTRRIEPSQAGGRIVVSGQDWAAQSAQVIEVGEPVTVIAADGIVLDVRR